MKYTIVSFSLKKIIYISTFTLLGIILFSHFCNNLLSNGNIEKYIINGIKTYYSGKDSYKMKVAKNNILLKQKNIEEKEKIVKAEPKKEEVVEEKTEEDDQIIQVMRNSNKDDTNYKEINYDAYQKILVRGVEILNYSYNRTIDYYSLFKKEIIFSKEKDKILLYNTHTSESYANSEKYKFGYSGTYRSTDARYNMINITSNLTDSLRKKNIIVLQDTTPHDYGSYNSSYKLSRKSFIKNLEKDSNFGVCIDLHRDAMGDLTKGYCTEIKGKKAAQLSIVIGLGTAKNPNKYGIDNLALAMQIVEVANKKYPGLFRKIIVRNSKYNQDLKKYSMLIEDGFTGNKIEEAEYSAKLLANVLNCFYK